MTRLTEIMMTRRRNWKSSNCFQIRPTVYCSEILLLVVLLRSAKQSWWVEEHLRSFKALWKKLLLKILLTVRNLTKERPSNRVPATSSSRSLKQVETKTLRPLCKMMELEDLPVSLETHQRAFLLWCNKRWELFISRGLQTQWIRCLVKD